MPRLRLLASGAKVPGLLESENSVTPSVVLIQQPAIDFDTLLGASHKLLGYSLSAKADQSHTIEADAERFISCLSAMRDPNAPAGITPNLLTHVSFSALIAADERDLIDILEMANMPFVTAETTMRGVMVSVVTGTLAQWRDAVKSGAGPGEFNVRACYCQIMVLFEQVGLNVWKDFQVKPQSDKTFFLEDKRR